VLTQGWTDGRRTLARGNAGYEERSRSSASIIATRIEINEWGNFGVLRHLGKCLQQFTLWLAHKLWGA